MTGHTIGSRLSRAQAQSEAARKRMSTTLSALQRRAAPRALAHDVAQTLQVRGSAAMNGAVTTAQRKPMTVVAVLSLLTLFLARHRIARLFQRRDRPERSGRRGYRPLPTQSPRESK